MLTLVLYKSLSVTLIKRYFNVNALLLDTLDVNTNGVRRHFFYAVTCRLARDQWKHRTEL